MLIKDTSHLDFFPADKKLLKFWVLVFTWKNTETCAKVMMLL